MPSELERYSKLNSLVTKYDTTQNMEVLTGKIDVEKLGIRTVCTGTIGIGWMPLAIVAVMLASAYLLTGWQFIVVATFGAVAMLKAIFSDQKSFETKIPFSDASNLPIGTVVTQWVNK